MAMGDPDLLREVISSPPMNTLVSAPSDAMIIKQRWKLKDGSDEFKMDLAGLEDERSLLSRVLYKNHNRFHNDPGYKDLRLLEKSLLKLLAHNFSRSTSTFLTYLPASPSSTQLPTSAMARHTALQLYGAAALLSRVLALCNLSAVSALQRISLGHFWGVAAHYLGVIGRIRTVSRRLLWNVHQVFTPLGALVNLLPGHAVGLSLPATLASFLPESMVAGLNLEETNPESENEVTSATKHHTSLDAFLDLGIPVKRPELESAKSLPSTLKTSASLKPETQNKKSDIFSDFHTLDQLREFLKQETKMRKIAKKSCATSKLKQEEWKRLRAEVMGAINEKTPNKSLKRCRKMLRMALL